MDAEFVAQVGAFAERLQGCPVDDPAAAKAWLEEHVPFDGAEVAALGAAARAGAEAGWLLPKEAGGIRFGRVAKDVHGFSVDAVWMDRPGPKHRHPGGEIDLCFAIDGEPTFDGNPEGWTVYRPDSVHVPTVAGGTMLILYFLPGAQIEFL